MKYMQNQLLNLDLASKYLSVAKSTLRRWDKEGVLVPVRINGGHRRYWKQDLDAFIGELEIKEEKKHIGAPRAVTYARCSTWGQKQHGDIERQSDRLVKYTIDKEYRLVDVIKDCGSGLNENRRGFNKLIRMIKEKKVDVLVIENKDRLTRFGFKTLNYFFESYGTKIEIVNDRENQSFEDELTQDMMMLLASFSGKLYSRRGKHNKNK